MNDVHGMRGEVQGSAFTSDAILMPLQNNPFRVVWQDGNAWRLRRVGQGSDPYQIPGEMLFLTRNEIKRLAAQRKVAIVVGNRSSGITSLLHWLSEKKDDFSCLSVNLTDAQLRGETPETRLAAIAGLIRRAAGDHKIKGDTADPLDAILDLARNQEVHAIAFREFEALDDETAMRFFGRLRSLIEEPAYPLQSLSILLLGHSIEALDIEADRPVSTLASTSNLYLTTPLFEVEIADMVEKAGLTADAAEIFRVTGGEPLLVQILLRLLAPSDEGPGRCQDWRVALDLLKTNRPPGVEHWIRGLQKKLKRDEAARRIVEKLLALNTMPEDSFERRSSFVTLYADGWVKFEKGAWSWQSTFRRELAAEAFAERSR